MSVAEFLDGLDAARAAGTTAFPWRQDSGWGEDIITADGDQFGATGHPADAALIVAAVNALPKLTAAVRAVEALADEWDARHSGWCCTQSCPEPDERHGDPTDPVHLDELRGMWSDNPPPLIEHRTIPCPGTCTCQVGPYIASIRAVLADALAGDS